jgi:hypothetical protein
MQLGVYAVILCPFIWSHVSGLMNFCDGFDKGTASNFVKNHRTSATDTLAMIRQVFKEESMNCTQKDQTH